MPNNAVADAAQRGAPYKGSRALQAASQQGITWTKVDDLAQRIALGYVPVAEYRQYPAKMLAAAQARSLEISSEMQDIADNPNIKGAEQVYRELAKVNRYMPLRAYVNGAIQIPSSAWRNTNFRDLVVKLGQKADPAFSQQTALQRFAAVKNATSGPNGRTLLSMAVANGHLNFVEQAAIEIQRAGGQITAENAAGSPFLNRIYQTWITEYAPDKYGNVDAKHSVLNFNNLVHLVAPEVARAQKGAAPTLGEIHDVESTLNATQDTPGLLTYLESSRHLIRQRFNEIGNVWKIQTGGHTVEDLTKVFEHSTRTGNASFELPKGANEVQPDVSTGDVQRSGAQLRDFLNNTKAWEGEAYGENPLGHAVREFHRPGEQFPHYYRLRPGGNKKNPADWQEIG
jgi:hypothetical protein